MASDWNLFTLLGLDPQLLTAGSAGGLVKAFFAKEKWAESVVSMISGALCANYFGVPAVSLLAAVELFGGKMTLRPEVGGFFVGLFAFIIVGFIGSKLRARMENGDAKP